MHTKKYSIPLCLPMMPDQASTLSNIQEKKMLEKEGKPHRCYIDQNLSSNELSLFFLVGLSRWLLCAGIPGPLPSLGPCAALARGSSTSNAGGETGDPTT